MAHSMYHSKSSARKFGGVWTDYEEIHSFMDSTKSAYADIKHRAILHSAFGIFLVEKIFGTVLIRKSDGKEVPIRPICEQHCIEDCGFIPTVQDWLEGMEMKEWMLRGAKPLSREFAQGD